MVISESWVCSFGDFFNLTSKNNCHLVLLASLNAKLSSSSRVNTHRWERGISLLMELSARKSFPKCQTVLFTSDEVIKQEKLSHTRSHSFVFILDEKKTVKSIWTSHHHYSLRETRNEGIKLDQVCVKGVNCEVCVV